MTAPFDSAAALAQCDAVRVCAHCRDAPHAPGRCTELIDDVWRCDCGHGVAVDSRLGATIRAAVAEIERLRAAYYTVVDAIARETTSAEHAAEIAMATRHERDAAVAEIERLRAAAIRLLEVGPACENEFPCYSEDGPDDRAEWCEWCEWCIAADALEQAVRS